MRPVIKSEKHITNFSRFTIANGTAVNRTLIQAVAVANKDASFEVTEGSIIKAIWIEFWVLANTSAPGSLVFDIEKVQNEKAPATFTEMNNLGAYNNKKNILFMFQGLTPPIVNSAPLTPYRGWLKIPKGKQRFGLGDELHVNFAPITEGLVVCGDVIFKEYS